MGRLGGRGRTGVIATLALLIAAAAIVVLVAHSSPSSASGSHQSAGTTGGSATVRRRNLVATDTESGTLSYAGAQTVYNRLGGTVTWLPPVGRTIKPGGVLYRVDGEPVILMSGSAPAYRTLSAADVDGNDVLELNRNLKRLGFDAAGITADDVWQPGTSLGVEELQESLGEEATGSLTLGQVVFLPGTQLVSELDTTVGSTGASGGSSGVAQDSSTAPLAGSAEFVSSTNPISTRTTTTTTTSSTTAPTASTSTTSTTPTAPKRGGSDGATKALSALARQLKAETTQLKAATTALKAAAQGSHHSSSSSSSSSHHSSSHHSSSSSHHSSSGSAGGSAQAILQTTSTRLVVTVDLSASSQSEARVGEHVSVEMPAGNSVGAKIIAVSRIAQSSNSGSGGEQGAGQGSGSGGGSAPSTVPVTIALTGRHRTAGLDQAAVSVAFVSRRARNVLSVPVTALVATSGSRYALQEANASHSLIPVSVGLFAAGDVQVSGSGVHAGLTVTDSQG
ncbi:MAG TPA: peptidoglycan-binding domain-containing protein [Solirubrobacteraceae bacterium]